MTKEIERCIRIMFPNDPEDRTRHILKRLRNDKDKDHHCAGSLTYLGRCALDHAAADLIESLSDQLEQVTRERDAAVEMFRDKCEYCKHFHVTHNGCTPDCDCHATDCQRIDGHWTGWQWIGVEVE